MKKHGGPLFRTACCQSIVGRGVTLSFVSLMFTPFLPLLRLACAVPCRHKERLCRMWALPCTHHISLLSRVRSSHGRLAFRRIHLLCTNADARRSFRIYLFPFTEFLSLNPA